MERERIFGNLIKIALIALLAQSCYLQIIRYPLYSSLSRKNCIRTIEIGLPRGRIVDRNERVLAQDIPSFNLVFVPYDLKFPERESELLAKLIAADRESLLKIFRRQYANPFDRFFVKKRLTREQVSLVEENAPSLPGIFVQAGIDRDYPLQEISCHLLGYVGEINRDQLDRMKDKGLKSGDVIGQYGLEKFYDDLLRGIPGGTQVEVDALGHQRRVLGTEEMKPGHELVLTIDQVIQEIAARNLGGVSGCVVAMDPRNGQILALTSTPGFDPVNIQDYLGKPNHPFLNRVVQAQYPPGSVFKIVTETAALETGAIEEYDRIECTGEIQVGDTIFHCWKEDGHGWVDINHALPFSCNIFFGTAGMKVGVSRMVDYARMFGLGERTGIDISDEKPGHLPDASDTGGPLNLAIGQGELLTTPLQLLCMISAVANGGDVWTPYLVKRIISPEGKLVKEFQPTLRKAVYVSPETMTILKNGLKNVVDIGTGGGARVEGLEVAGKTGTAQRAGSEMALSTHGAFACYAPADAPTFALVVFLDNAASSQAAHIAAGILKEVFFPPEQETGIDTSIQADPARSPEHA